MIKKRLAIPTRKPNPVQVSSVSDLLIRGFGLHQRGDLNAAGKIYTKILELQPLHFDALQLNGLLLGQSGKHEEAVKYLQAALDINPNESAVNNNIGITFHNLGMHELAIESYGKAISAKLNYDEAFYNRGLAHQSLGNLDLAQADYESTTQINPRHIGALTNLGNVFQLKKRYEDAISCYQKAIDLNSNFAQPYNNRGNLYHDLQMYSNALEDYARALKINPNYAEALSNRGNTLHALKKIDEALKSYDLAINLNINNADVRFNRANLFCELGRFDEALRDFEIAMSINSQFPYLKGVRLATKMRICDWSNFEEDCFNLKEGIENSKKVSQPFWIFAMFDSLEIQKKAAQIWIEDKHPLKVDNGFIGSRRLPDQKIKLAYYSADFHNHATMYLMAQLFELHNKSKFEVFGFSFGPDSKDEMRARAVSAFDHFYNVRDKTDQEVARISREIGIDIAVDLKGFTQNYRAGIFASRAAPIQINYLGYPGTMAANYMDYIIADSVTIPKEMQNKYQEKVLYMPFTYQVNDGSRKISEKNYSRGDFGLPDQGFVFCCFNNNYKITPSVFDSWIEILNQVENSVLWLLEDNSWASINLRREASARGLDPRRLIFAEKMPLAEHLARHRLADLFLDTFPCNAHTTASDALWAGLPLITMAGESFASRVAASLLHAIGLPDLVTNNQKQYQNLAISLGNNAINLKNIKLLLSKNIAQSPLFNIKKYVYDLEALYIGIFNSSTSAPIRK
jgi:predicted O-linked N-acetylglucosamine transferase (SPINDLY family)